MVHIIIIIIFIHFVLDENEKGNAQKGGDEQKGNDDDYRLWHDHNTFEGMEADLDGDHSLAPRNSLRRSAALYLLTLKEQLSTHTGCNGFFNWSGSKHVSVCFRRYPKIIGRKSNKQY